MARKRQKKESKIQHCWSSIGVWGSQAPRCERLAEVVHCRNCEVFSRAGRSVFERRPPKQYLAQWRKTLARPQRQKEKGRLGVMVFRLADEWYALPASRLQEVATLRAVHRIPHNSSRVITGIVNIGGEVQLCYSLARLLGVDEQDTVPEQASPRMLVIELNDERYVFPVHEVSGLEHCVESALAPAPTTVAGERREFLQGMFRSGDRQVALLDPDSLQRGIERYSA